MNNQPLENSKSTRAGGLGEPWISVADVAEHLGVKRDTVYKWLERGRIPAHKVGRLWKFKLSEIDKWVVTGSSAAGLGNQIIAKGVSNA